VLCGAYRVRGTEGAPHHNPPIPPRVTKHPARTGRASADPPESLEAKSPAAASPIAPCTAWTWLRVQQGVGVSRRSIGCAAREIASTATRAMPTITVVPHVGVLDAARWEADVAAPGGYGEWGARGAVRLATLQWVCVAWWRGGGGGAQGRSRTPPQARD